MALALEFEYVKPRTIGQAVKALAKFSQAQILAGGTDLIGWLMEDMARPDALVDIKGVRGLKKITVSQGRMSLGCLVTFSDVLDTPRIRKKTPLLWEMAGRVASSGIRNRATLVGNICSAVPCTDAGASLLVYDASVNVVGPGGKRDIPLEDWFVGPRQTLLGQGEIAVGVSFDLPTTPCGACWAKLGRYRGEDLAQASVAVIVLPEDQYRVSFGSVAPRPLRGRAIEELLNGKSLTAELVAEAVALVPDTIAPITDIRATSEYRMGMVKVMLQRCLETAVARRDGKGPEYGEHVI